MAMRLSYRSEGLHIGKHLMRQRGCGIDGTNLPPISGSSAAIGIINLISCIDRMDPRSMSSSSAAIGIISEVVASIGWTYHRYRAPRRLLASLA